jgi:hypothetical protein
MGEPSTTKNKQSKQPVDVEVKEVAGSLTKAPLAIFHRDYLLLRKDDSPPITIPVNAKYPLTITIELKGISSDVGMLGKVDNLNFMDHNITDMQKLPKLARDYYLCTTNGPDTRETWVEPQEWVSGLEKAGILKLFEIPHLDEVQKSSMCQDITQLCPWRNGVA